MVGKNFIYLKCKLFSVILLAAVVTANPISSGHHHRRSYSNKLKKMHVIADELVDMTWIGHNHGSLPNTNSGFMTSAEEQQQRKENKESRFLLADGAKDDPETKTKSSSFSGPLSINPGSRTNHQKNVRKGRTLSRAFRKFWHDKEKGAEKQRRSKNKQENRNDAKQNGHRSSTTISVSDPKVGYHIASVSTRQLYRRSSERHSVTKDDIATTANQHTPGKTAETTADTNHKPTNVVTVKTAKVSRSETSETSASDDVKTKDTSTNMDVISARTDSQSLENVTHDTTNITDVSTVVNGTTSGEIHSATGNKFKSSNNTHIRSLTNRGPRDYPGPLASDKTAEDAVKETSKESSETSLENRPRSMRGKLFGKISKRNRNSQVLDKQHLEKLRNESLEIEVVDIVVVAQARQEANQALFDVQSIAFIAALSGFAALVFLAGMLTIKYRSEVKILLYTRLGVDLGGSKQREHRKQYDVFIAYSQDNSHWVNETLIKKLENLDSPYTLQIISRDVMRGGSINENILLKIEKCAATIVVLSKGFADSGWCLLTVYNADKAQTKDSSHRIIPIVMPEFDMDEVDFKAQLMIKTNVLLASDDTLFWDKLIYALPAPLKKFRRPSRVSTTTLKAQSLAQWAEDRLSEPDESAEIY